MDSLGLSHWAERIVALRRKSILEENKEGGFDGSELHDEARMVLMSFIDWADRVEFPEYPPAMSQAVHECFSDLKESFGQWEIKHALEDAVRLLGLLKASIVEVR